VIVIEIVIVIENNTLKLLGRIYGTAEFYNFMGRYHSGPFSLLLDFGLLGTISFTAFLEMLFQAENSSEKHPGQQHPGRRCPVEPCPNWPQ